MTNRPSSTTFRLAPLSPVLLIVTLVLLALPIAFFVAVLSGASLHPAPGLLVVAVYVWIWLRFRPVRFVVREQSLDVVWPLKCRTITRDSIVSVQLLDRERLKEEIGWGLRMGAGGLGGGFGWLWTRRRGIVQMYVSRTDGFVWIERKQGRPWLITPDHPEAFVRALSG